MVHCGFDNRMKNKKGWIRVVEAFLAAMVILVVLILVINQQSSGQQNSSSAVAFNAEISILQNIELNATLREDIISISDSGLPVNSEDAAFPTSVKNAISSLTSKSYSYLSCSAQICATDSECGYWKNVKSEIYSQSVLITSTLTSYNPRKLSLFCTTIL